MTPEEVQYVDTMAATDSDVWVTVLGDRDNEAPNRAVLIAADGDVVHDVVLPGRRCHRGDRRPA